MQKSLTPLPPGGNFAGSDIFCIHCFKKTLIFLQTEKLIESESLVAKSGLKQQELNDTLQGKSSELEKMRVGHNETKKLLEASKAENQSLVSKEQQLSKKVQTCSGEIVELKGQLQVELVKKF